MRREFAEGTIVRRKPIDKKEPIGPYMRVTMANRHYVYARPINMKDDVIITRQLCHRVKVTNLMVSTGVIIGVLKGVQTVISHPATPQWKSLIDNQPELIMFYDNTGWYKAWCTIDLIETYRSFGENMVRICIGYIVDRHPLI